VYQSFCSHDPFSLSVLPAFFAVAATSCCETPQEDSGIRFGTIRPGRGNEEEDDDDDKDDDDDVVDDDSGRGSGGNEGGKGSHCVDRVDVSDESARSLQKLVEFAVSKTGFGTLHGDEIDVAEAFTLLREADGDEEAAYMDAVCLFDPQTPYADACRATRAGKSASSDQVSALLCYWLW
jgi:hypothetical protein